jgi:hypothetical protein
LKAVNHSGSNQFLMCGVRVTRALVTENRCINDQNLNVGKLDG